MYIQCVRVRLHIQVVYEIEAVTKGLCLASTNWNKNYEFRYIVSNVDKFLELNKYVLF